MQRTINAIGILTLQERAIGSKMSLHCNLK